MMAVKSIDVRDNFRAFCDRAFHGETIIVSRKKNENVVIIGEQEYNELLKSSRNAEYLAKLDRSFAQLERGEIVVKSLSELEAMAGE